MPGSKSVSNSNDINWKRIRRTESRQIVLKTLEGEALHYTGILKKINLEYTDGVVGLKNLQNVSNQVSWLKKHGLVEQVNCGANKCDGYYHLITPKGKEVLKVWETSYHNLSTVVLDIKTT